MFIKYCYYSLVICIILGIFSISQTNAVTIWMWTKTLELCNKLKGEYDARDRSYKRSECFKDPVDQMYKYYRCSLQEECRVEKIVKENVVLTEVEENYNTIESNESTLPVSYKWALDKRLKELEKLEIKELEGIIRGIWKLQRKYADSKLAWEILKYFKQWVEGIIIIKKSWTSWGNWIEWLMCTLIGNCKDFPVIVKNPKNETSHNNSWTGSIKLPPIKTTPVKLPPITISVPEKNYKKCELSNLEIDKDKYTCLEWDYKTLSEISTKSCYIGSLDIPLTGKWIKSGATYSFTWNNLITEQTLYCKGGALFKQSQSTHSIGWWGGWSSENNHKIWKCWAAFNKLISTRPTYDLCSAGKASTAVLSLDKSFWEWKCIWSAETSICKAGNDFR